MVLRIPFKCWAFRNGRFSHTPGPGAHGLSPQTDLLWPSLLCRIPERPISQCPQRGQSSLLSRLGVGWGGSSGAVWDPFPFPSLAAGPAWGPASHKDGMDASLPSAGKGPSERGRGSRLIYWPLPPSHRLWLIQL